MAKIVLIGFPGSGKTTVGKKLASRLSLPFFDTDSHFEDKYCISIPDFFQKYGETYFRICERAVLEELLNLETDSVIATGGGLPCYRDSLDLINEKSLSVYLKMSSSSLVTRLSSSHRVRPLIREMSLPELTNYVETTLISREIFYNRAQLIYKGENMVIADLVSALVSAGYKKRE